MESTSPYETFLSHIHNVLTLYEHGGNGASPHQMQYTGAVTIQMDEILTSLGRILGRPCEDEFSVSLFITGFDVITPSSDIPNQGQRHTDAVNPSQWMIPPLVRESLTYDALDGP